jgi:hypothetical protein
VPNIVLLLKTPLNAVTLHKPYTLIPAGVVCAVGARGGDADFQRRGVQGAVVDAPAARGGPGGVLHLVPPLQGLPEVLRGACDASLATEAHTLLILMACVWGQLRKCHAAAVDGNKGPVCALCLQPMSVLSFSYMGAS